MSTRYVGVDIGKQKCAIAIMDQNGFILDEFVFRNNNEGIETMVGKLSIDDKVVMESTGAMWTNLYNQLDERHIPMILANPLKTRAIASAKIKSEKLMRGFLHIY